MIRRAPVVLAQLLALACWMQTALAQVHAGPYVPSPSVIVDEMLALAAVRENDFLVDLGSGDGRIVITAAQRYGARGYGVDIDPKLVALATENARRAGVGDRVSFEERDLFVTDLGRASVVTIYLLPGTVTQLIEKLRRELRPGARVVSHDYPLVPWREDRTVKLEVEEKVAISGSMRTGALSVYGAGARRRRVVAGAAPAAVAAATRGRGRAVSHGGDGLGERSGGAARAVCRARRRGGGGGAGRRRRGPAAARRQGPWRRHGRRGREPSRRGLARDAPAIALTGLSREPILAAG